MDSDKISTQVGRLEVVETGRRRRWSEDEKLKIVLESSSAAPDRGDGAAIWHFALIAAAMATVRTSPVVQVFGRRQRRDARHAELAGVQKAPRHEVAGSLAPAGQRALWGFDPGAELGGERHAGRLGPAGERAGDAASVRRASERGLGVR